MEKKNTPAGVEASPLWATLERFARQEIQGFIQGLLEQEVTDLLGRGKSCRRTVVDSTPGYRNGYGKPRRLTLSNGTITLQRPRVRGLEERFESRVLPLFQRRTREVGAVLPELYLHGLAQGDFTLALRGLLGEGAPLSASSIARLTAGWAAEYGAWRERSLAELDLVYLWADGLYVKAGLEDTKAALLVVIGALSDGRKVVLAVEPGQRESTASWAEVLRSLKARGLSAPRLTVADGHLGLWGALAQVYPESAEQRCWNHRIVNLLDAVPLKHQGEVRVALRAIAYAATRAEAERLHARFAQRYRARFPKAVERLAHDWDRLVAYYDFPQEHWRHLRTTNVVESPFDAVRLRTSAAKRFKKVENGSAMIWKLLLVAERSFRRLNAPELLPAVYAGAKYVDGIAEKVRPGRLAA
ncbi:MAG: IS256 family transposase [candidate division NC10 bacterium]|nr:IS256 family transposase [candidate division NC10 bacterium]